MKTIIVYASQTGFTKRYAEWLGEDLGADVLPLAVAKKKSDTFFDSAEAIVYAGWAMGGKIVKSEWFTNRIPQWKGKKLALVCVGAGPNGLPEVEEALHRALTDEERNYAKAFYCQGGIAYEKMKLPAKLAMKAFATMVRKKKDATQQEKEMGEMISHSYDIADKKFIEPIVDYVREERKLK